MALNLSTLTNASTSATVLAEAQTTADFLDSVPILKNIARGSNKGGDGKQTTALNQPKALPLDVNGKGYCYLPATTGNAPAVTFPTIGANDDFVLEMVAYVVNSDEFHLVTGANANNRFLINYSFNTHFFDGYTQIPLTQLSSGLSTLTVERSSGLFQLKQNGVVKSSLSNHTRSYDFNHLSFNGQFSTGAAALNGYIQKATLSIEGTEELNIDFTATNVRHNDTKFKCATGQTVTINQAGNDPATVIKRSVLRFTNQSNNTTSIALQGLLNQTIDSGYMFAAFSVLGDGGEPTARIFSINSTGAFDSDSESAIFSLRNNTNPADLFSYNAQWFSGHGNMFNDDNGDILHQSLIKNGTQKSLVNGAGVVSSTNATTISSEEFNIVVNDSGVTNNAAIDLEFLALFPATITDAEAARVVNYINNRNTVFDLKDSLGYYFFDPQVFPNASPAAFVSYWNGNIVGSDNTLNSAVTQTVAIDQPTRDGFKIGFTSNTDHLDIPSTTQAGWQVVGTSLGTFAYKVNANAVTELNLLGNAGGVRIVGDLYGIILLPETANGKQIEAARKLLIDRGAADGTTETNLYAYWYNRADMVEFKHVNTSSGTNFNLVWHGCTSLTSFPAIDMSSGASFVSAWKNCSALTSFLAIDARNGTTFTSAWQSCTALTSFPAGAKLGTAATGVNFNSAFRSSGLTALPAGLDLSKGDNFISAFQQCGSLTTIDPSVLLGTAHETATVNFTSAFRFNYILTELPAGLDMSQGSLFNQAFEDCSSLTTIGDGVLLGTAASNVSFNSAFRTSGLTALPAGLDMSQGSSFSSAFYGCTSLTTIGNGVLLGTASSSVDFTQAFRGCTNLVTLPANLNLSSGDDFQNIFRDCSSLVTFPAGAFDTMGTPQNWCFQYAFYGCSSLSGASVDAILDSIDTSGQSGPTIVTTEANITIDYDTGTTAPAYTTLASLKAKGWVVIVNGTTL